MPAEPDDGKQSPTAPRGHAGELFLLAVVIAFISAFMLAMLLHLFDPDAFGSCFEGGCGYAAMFGFVPVATFALAPIWWFCLRRAGPLSRLILWFLLLFVAGHFILAPLISLPGLAGLLWMMVRLWRENNKRGQPINDLFVKPVAKRVSSVSQEARAGKAT